MVLGTSGAVRCEAVAMLSFADEVLDYVQEAHDVDAHEVEACGR
ncbi:hypothetical protein Kole_1316 [Kosmotoga olearia TBF 19.5.1]|uniref:Uncharacterized protein n=1 Tax=Kosmotoga olearia (strain ATCC BAA-1733 / DSM 21960 / TBF 19.5.1) TaxID=521045 RepID=C5CDE7_KOSOT|nr:hypothetical protein Kole_1316 [Kosmotoga olearia TBF 19.5.1]